jgi:hypothetical protein
LRFAREATANNTAPGLPLPMEAVAKLRSTLAFALP